MVFYSLIRIFAAIKYRYMEFREMMEQREQSQACLDSAESRQDSTFRQMRRKRQQLAEEESIAILEKATAGTLALLGDNDYPYAVPISYVYHDRKLYFHSALAGHKVDAIRKCDKASFCVIEQDDVQPEKYLQKEIENGLSRMLAIRFDIEHLTGKEAIELVRGRQNNE